MGKASLRGLGVALWCAVGAACGVHVETEGTGVAGAAGSPPGDPAPLCGVENTERVADILCAVTAAWCEQLAGCCQAEGFPGTARDCQAQQGPVCIERVRADLAAGACFDLAAYTPACDELTLESFSSCSTLGLLSVDLLRRSEALGCSNFWIHGEVPGGASCTPGSAAQCAQGEGERSFCFPDATTSDFRNTCRVFRRRALGESCEAGSDNCPGGSLCNSSGVCAVPGDTGAPCVDALSDCRSRFCREGVCADLVGAGCEEGDSFPCGVYGVCGADGLCRERSFANEVLCDFGANAAVLQ